MSTAILIHDSGRQGHPGWVREQLRARRADGAILDPFHSPAEGRSRQWAASRCITELRDEFPDAELLFDPSTHAVLLPGTSNWVNYESWPLWPNERDELSTPAARRDHVEAVLAVQHDLGVPALAPTVALERPDGPAAELALQLAAEARRQDPSVVQALVARRSCWSAGHLLDAHIGRLASLRAQRWLVTWMRDTADFPPDVTDLDATAGHARSVHSLSQRSRVTLGHSADGFAIPALAAGANALGTGWFSKQRICSPGLFGASASGGQYILWSPHLGLLARLRSDVAEALQDADPAFARSVRGDRDLPLNEAEYRAQHLATMRDIVDVLDRVGTGPTSRVPAARTLLTNADTAWAHAVQLGVAEVGARERTRWVSTLRSGFEVYAQAEGL